MPAPGQKAKFVNVMDQMLADDIQPLYSIEMALAKSPKMGVKCGAIVVFKTNNEALDLNPEQFTERSIAEMQNQIAESTQIQVRDPELFKETEGRWIPWAIEEMFTLFDKYNSNATFAVVCAELQIHERISKRKIMKLRGQPRELFKTAFEIDRLLSKGFKYDPWSRGIRRGRIGAGFSKR